MTASKLEFLEIFEAIDEPLGICDADGVLLALTRRARGYLGVAEGQTVCLDLGTRATFSEMRSEGSGRPGEFFMADVPVDGASRAAASVYLSPTSAGNFRVQFETADVFEEMRGADLLLPVLDRVDELVVVCDRRRRVRVYNAVFGRAVDPAHAADAIVGRDILELFEPDSAAALRASAATALAGAEAEAVEATIGGETMRLSVRPLVVRDSAGEATRGLVIVGQTGRVSLGDLEDKLAQAERMMNLGQLATGVAHELKNPLTSILNYADYLRRKYQDQLFEKRDGERLQRIVEGVERMDQFVRDLLQMARPDAQAEFQPVRIDHVIQNAMGLCELSLDETQVRVVADLGAAGARVLGLPGQLEQVFVNLINNARNAMPSEGGTIRVSTRVEAGAVVCRVADDANGMPESIVRRIFEPFFTTRGSQDGTGLGLALVRTIVDRHQGTIEVDSREGEGTEFVVRLPCADADGGEAR